MILLYGSEVKSVAFCVQYSADGPNDDLLFGSRVSRRFDAVIFSCLSLIAHIMTTASPPGVFFFFFFLRINENKKKIGFKEIFI